MIGLTFDTGVLIALERRDRRATSAWTRAIARRAPITVPAPVVAEWWRGQGRVALRLLDGVTVEPLDETLARVAGEALAKVRAGRPSVVDAVVMASAARRGDVVLTSDVEDFERLRAVFPSVRVLRIGGA